MNCYVAVVCHAGCEGIVGGVSARVRRTKLGSNFAVGRVYASNSHLLAVYSNRVAVVVEQPVKIKFPFGS